MKILVTGATGFVGNYVVEQLLEARHTVIATSTNVETAKQKPWFNKVIFVEHNIIESTSENLFKKFNSPNCLIHLAWSNLNDFKNKKPFTM